MLDAAIITCIDNKFYITSTESCLNIQTALYMLYFKTTACLLKGCTLCGNGGVCLWCVLLECPVTCRCC